MSKSRLNSRRGLFNTQIRFIENLREGHNKRMPISSVNEKIAAELEFRAVVTTKQGQILRIWCLLESFSTQKDPYHREGRPKLNNIGDSGDVGSLWNGSRQS
jgi:hypothetical protein